MPVLPSVFSRPGKTFRDRLKFPHVGKAQSPPSPASFVSPEVNDKPFNPYPNGLYEASKSSLNQTIFSQNSTQTESNKRSSGPKLPLDLDHEPLWFPKELLQPTSEVHAPLPERNASLGPKTVAGSSTGVGGNIAVGKTSASSLLTLDVSANGRLRAGSHSSTLPQHSVRSRADSNAAPPDTRSRSHNPELDDVIDIAADPAPRGRDPTRSPLASSFSKPLEPVLQSGEISAISAKRPLPSPIKIPTSLSVKSVENLPAAAAGSSPLSRNPSLTRSRHHSLTRSRSRLRSRPNSTYSDTDIDNLNSAVSGTTLARALHSSYALPTPSTSSSPPSAMPTRGKGHLARQDSATLPRGELPFEYNRKSLRSSKSSVAVSTTGSTYWRDRRISGDQIVVVSPEDGWRGEVPPVPPIPNGVSPDTPPYSRSRRPSANASDSEREGNVRLTAEWRRSNGARRVADMALDHPSELRRSNGADLVLDRPPDAKRRRISKVPEGNVSQASFATSGSTSDTGASTTSTAQSRDHVPAGSWRAGALGPQQLSPPVSLNSSHNTPSSSSTSPSVSSSQDTPGYDTPPSSQAQSVTSPQNYAVAQKTGVHMRISMSRSSSESSPRRSLTGPRPLSTLLPIGDRPRSSSVRTNPTPLRSSQDSATRPHSFMSPLQPPPPAAPSSQKDSPESPDLLDIMFMDSHVGHPNGSGTTRSPPAPINVPTPGMPGYDFVQEDSGGLTGSGMQQTFPETPYAFTPTPHTGSFVPPPPPLPEGTPPPMPRTATLTRVRHSQKSDVGKAALMRSATMAQFSSTKPGLPMTPPPSGAEAHYHPPEEPVTVPNASGPLSAIEEGSAPTSPLSRASTFSTTPEHSPAPTSRTSATGQSFDAVSLAKSERPPSLVSSKRSLTPLPSPPASAVPLPPSPLPSPLPSPARPKATSDTFGYEQKSATPSPTYATVHMQQVASPPPSPSVFLMPVDTSQPPTKVEPLKPEFLSAVEATPNKRYTRSRPPPPTGPRKPSNPSSLLSRSRAGSVASSLGSPSGGIPLPGGLATPTTSASAPRFQTTPVKFRGLTMEAAQWTFTSEQLQATVSTAIKKSSDASSIRLLPIEMLTEQIPAEISRLEALSAELRTNYKLAVRKRKMLLASLRAMADCSEPPEHCPYLRLLDDVAELTDYMDHLSEDLYSVTDQLSQLTHLRDVHFGSALAMGLRKLNTSYIKHLAEKESLRQQVASLEAEMAEAWTYAQDAARELDDLNDKVALSEGVITPASSRRSSRVVIARKVSLRKAGIRSPSRLRSQRSSVASRSSLALSMSPALRNTIGADHVPPVPPIPSRTPLGISTADLPGRSSATTSEANTPLTDMYNNMQQAQEELCRMLGISPEDLRATPVSSRPKRSLSLSATMRSPRSARSFMTRSSSDGSSPNLRVSETWRLHRSHSVDGMRSAVLATIGMSSM